MKNKISGKTKLIIVLIVLITLISVLPIKEIIIEPSIIGATIGRVFVRPLEENHSCSTVFFEGWNLISIPCLASNTSVDFVLSSINGNYTSIHGYITVDSSDPWKAYNPDLPSWVIQDLTDVNDEQGYWLNMNNQTIFYLNGTLRTPAPISLVQGWNLMGYPANNSKEITNALATIDGSYTIVWSYNTTDDSYYYYNVSAGNGTLKEMRPYHGYWINMTNDDTLYVT